MIFRNCHVIVDSGYVYCDSVEIIGKVNGQLKIRLHNVKPFELYCISGHSIEVYSEDCSECYLGGGGFGWFSKEDSSRFTLKDSRIDTWHHCVPKNYVDKVLRRVLELRGYADNVQKWFEQRRNK
jgi:hypothetical protein